MLSRAVIVVSGANKGIGLEIVRGLCAQNLAETDVLLTARDAARGEAAVEQLKQQGLSAKFHQLDITNHDSVVRLRTFIESTYTGIAGLVNNAGFAFKNSAKESFAVQAKETVRINFFGTLSVCQELLPLMQPGGRVVNVASMAGSVSILSPALRDEVMRPDLTEDDLTSFMQVPRSKSKCFE